MDIPIKKNHTDPTATVNEFQFTAEEFNQLRSERAFGLISGLKHLEATPTTFTITKGMAHDASYLSYTGLVPNVIRLSANITKSISSAWTAGNGGGALVSGTALTANTWYYVYVIGSADNTLNDVCVSHINGTPSLPAGYTRHRLVGVLRTNISKNIEGFYQIGEGNNRTYYWREPRFELSASGGAFNLPLTLSFVPPIERKIVTLHIRRAGSTSGGQQAFVWSESLYGTTLSTAFYMMLSGVGGDTTDISHRFSIAMPANNLARYFITSSASYSIQTDSYTVEL